jgi:hypothetical protein
LGSATIGASASGVAPANVTSAQFAPQPATIGDFQVPLPQGVVKTLQLPSAITSGPDGNVWFGVGSASYGIVKMSPSGNMLGQFYSAMQGLPNAKISGLATGADGNVWYASSGDVGSISPSGAVNDYPLTGTGLCAGDSAQRIIAAAPSDGGHWFTIQCTTDSQLGHVSENGTLTYTNLPGFQNIEGLVLGKDGNVYVVGQLVDTDAGVLQAVVSGQSVSHTNVVDVTTVQAEGLMGIAQSGDGDLWATTGNCMPSDFVRIHIAVAFSSSPTDAFQTTTGCEAPAFPTAVADGSLWAPESAYPLATHVIPALYPAAPLQVDVPLPTPPTIPGSEIDVTVGANGDLYFADASGGAPTYAGDIVQFGY